MKTTTKPKKNPFVSHMEKYDAAKTNSPITKNVMSKQYIRELYNRKNKEINEILGLPNDVNKQIHLAEGVVSTINNIVFQRAQRIWRHAKNKRLGSVTNQKKHVMAL